MGSHFHPSLRENEVRFVPVGFSSGTPSQAWYLSPKLNNSLLRHDPRERKGILKEDSFRRQSRWSLRWITGVHGRTWISEPRTFAFRRRIIWEISFQELLETTVISFVLRLLFHRGGVRFVRWGLGLYGSKIHLERRALVEQRLPAKIPTAPANNP